MIPAPIDSKNIAYEFIESFVYDDYLCSSQGKSRIICFLRRNCLCVIEYTIGCHRFSVRPILGRQRDKELCVSDFQCVVDRMNTTDKSSDVIVKTFGVGNYGFYFEED